MTLTAKAAATRSNLVHLRRRLEQVEKGAALLRKKREALVAELFERARPVVDVRRAVEEQARTAYRALLEALAQDAQADLGPLGWPSRALKVDLVARDVGGVHGVELGAKPIVVRSAAARGSAAGPGDAEATAAAEAFERLLERLLEAAPEELFLRRLGDALRDATRLVNTLEQRVARSLDHDLGAMQRTLDEREREEHLRLRRLVASRSRQRAAMPFSSNTPSKSTVER